MPHPKRRTAFNRSAVLSVAVLVALGLVAVGCGDDSESGASDAKKGKTIEVTLTDSGCEPHSISAKAGPTTFHVTNEDSSAVTEFEVLDGGKIHRRGRERHRRSGPRLLA